MQREEHPLQQSRSSRGERRERERREGGEALLSTARLEENSGTGLWILELLLAEDSPEWMESRVGE